MVDDTAIREQNPWWTAREKILEDEKVKEALSRKNKLLYPFKDKRNKIILGPRQTGKTTQFKLLIYDLIMRKNVNPKRIFYFSCESLRRFEEIIELIRRVDFLIDEDEKYVFLDEISFVEEWQRAVKYILDSPLARNKVFHITGSSSINLRKENFPGRAIEITESMPKTFRNFIEIFGSSELKKSLEKNTLEFKNNAEVLEKTRRAHFHQEEIDKLFHRYLQCGGFPRAFYELMEEHEIKEETYETYWRWLIHDIAKINRSEKIVSGILMGILKNYTVKFSLSSLAKEVEIGSHVTIREYLELLEDLFAIRNFHTLDPAKKTVVYRKMRKVYFTDPFLFHAAHKKITGKNADEYDKIVEGVVVETLARKIKNEFKIGFHHNGKEVDVCFEDFGLEVKWQEKADKKDFPGTNIKNKILLTKKGGIDFNEKEGLLTIPTSLLLAVT